MSAFPLHPCSALPLPRQPKKIDPVPDSIAPSTRFQFSIPNSLCNREIGCAWIPPRQALHGNRLKAYQSKYVDEILQAVLVFLMSLVFLGHRLRCRVLHKNFFKNTSSKLKQPFHEVNRRTGLLNMSHIKKNKLLTAALTGAIIPK